MAEQNDIDHVSGKTTTGHAWDGIKELNTPLPRWWLLTFYATIIWAIGYWIAYPAWPLVSSYTTGVLGWSSRGAVAVAVQPDRPKRTRSAQKTDRGRFPRRAAVAC